MKLLLALLTAIAFTSAIFTIQLQADLGRLQARYDLTQQQYFDAEAEVDMLQDTVLDLRDGLGLLDDQDDAHLDAR